MVVVVQAVVVAWQIILQHSSNPVKMKLSILKHVLLCSRSNTLFCHTGIITGYIHSSTGLLTTAARIAQLV
jgi:hypothetical protein